MRCYMYGIDFFTKTMSKIPDSPAQTTEIPDFPQVQPTQKPNRILFYLVLGFGIFWEIYLALCQLANYLQNSLQYSEISRIIFSGLGLNVSSTNDGVFAKIMEFFVFFFFFIPTLRYICLLCFIRTFFYYFLTIEGSSKKTYLLLRIIYFLWSAYYIAFFIYLVQEPLKTSYSWPMTPFLLTP